MDDSDYFRIFSMQVRGNLVLVFQPGHIVGLVGLGAFKVAKPPSSLEVNRITCDPVWIFQPGAYAVQLGHGPA